MPRNPVNDGRVTTVTGRLWRDGQSHDEEFTFEAISDCLASEDRLVWADIYDPDHEALAALAAELHLDMWAVEDAVAPKERTKASVYRTHTFFTVYAVDILGTGEDESITSTLVKHRISAFVLPRGLITVRLPSVNHPEVHFDIREVSQRFDELGGQQYGVGALVHALLDVVVDGHFDAVQSLDDAIEGLEDELFDDSGPRRGLQRRTFRLRKELVELRRAVLPMREVVGAIQHRRRRDGHYRRRFGFLSRSGCGLRLTLAAGERQQRHCKHDELVTRRRNRIEHGTTLTREPLRGMRSPEKG